MYVSYFSIVTVYLSSHDFERADYTKSLFPKFAGLILSLVLILIALSIIFDSMYFLIAWLFSLGILCICLFVASWSGLNALRHQIAQIEQDLYRLEVGALKEVNIWSFKGARLSHPDPAVASYPSPHTVPSSPENMTPVVVSTASTVNSTFTFQVPPRLERLRLLLVACSIIDIVCIIACYWYGLNTLLSTTNGAHWMTKDWLMPNPALYIAEVNIQLALILSIVFIVNSEMKLSNI